MHRLRSSQCKPRPLPQVLSDKSAIFSDSFRFFFIFFFSSFATLHRTKWYANFICIVAGRSQLSNDLVIVTHCGGTHNILCFCCTTMHFFMEAYNNSQQQQQQQQRRQCKTNSNTHTHIVIYKRQT